MESTNLSNRLYNDQSMNIDRRVVNYNLCILAIFKNEAMNLDVWIRHYIWQGIDHFYLINNGSTDNYQDILKTYSDKVTLYNLPDRHKQNQHYQTVYEKENLSTITKWLIMADFDEFWYCYNSTIRDELLKYEQHEVIYTGWRMFGSDGLITHPPDIRTAITHRTSRIDGADKKWICQTKNILSSQIDTHMIKDKKGIRLHDIFRLNHYPVQSLEYFTKIKMTRGDAASKVSEHVRDMKYFERYDKNMDIEDNDLKNMVIACENCNTV